MNIVPINTEKQIFDKIFYLLPQLSDEEISGLFFMLQAEAKNRAKRLEEMAQEMRRIGGA